MNIENKIYLSKDGNSNTYIGSLSMKFACFSRPHIKIPIEKYTTKFNMITLRDNGFEHSAVLLNEERASVYCDKNYVENSILIINE